MSDEPVDNLTGRWIWLYPTTFLLHIAEEGWAGGGFSAWLARVDVHMAALRWWIMNLGFLLLMTLVIWLGTESYSPGLFSGLLIWTPLGFITLFVARKRVRTGVFVLGMVAGLVLRASVIATAVGVSRL